MATNEELETRLDGLEGLLVAEGEAPSGPEYSFPVPGQPIDQDQFQLLSLTDGNGVIDRGGSPYRLEGHGSDAETNQKGTLVLRVSTVTKKSEAKVAGYYHVMTRDKEFEFPPVAVKTVRTLSLTYDPRTLEESGGEGEYSGPIRVINYDSDPPKTFGRVQVPLWRVTQEPNQLLSDAKIEKLTPRVVPTQLVYTEDQLPEPSQCVWGALYFIHETSEIVMAVGANQSAGGPTRWKNLTSPEWVESTSGAFPAGPSGFKPARRIVGDRVEFRGRCVRSDGSKFVSGSTYTLVPNTLDAKSTLIMNAGSDSTRNPIAMEVETGGKPVFRPKADTPYIDLTGFFYYWK